MLNSLLKHLQRNAELLHQYENVIKTKNQKVNIPSDKTDNLLHYLPHHAVMQEDKKTLKPRIVYNASVNKWPGTKLLSVVVS